MAAKQLRTFNDIYTAVMEEVKIQSTDTTFINRIKRDINEIYQQEIVPHKPWTWIRKKIDLGLNAYISTGTVTVTEGSTSITFSSAPTTSVKDYIFFTNGYEEIYEISTHTSNSTSAVLKSPYKGTSSTTATYKLFQGSLVLPTDIVETYRVWHNHSRESLNTISDKDFLDLSLYSPRTEGKAEYYRVSEEYVPADYTTISGLPAVSSGTSSGNLRTITFAATVASYLEVGDRIRIGGSPTTHFNGDVIVEEVSTSTISYVHPVTSDKALAAAGLTTVKILDVQSTNETVRKVYFYPALYNKNITIHIEGIKKVSPLENDNDEPLIPIQDRIVLLYGTLSRVWSKVRNPEEAARNQQLYLEKLSKMASRIQDSTDFPEMKIDVGYLTSKRLPYRSNRWSDF